MNIAAVVLLTAVVWAISLIRSVRMRALVYSLPLPMTLALVSTEFGVDGGQVLGVLGLNLFFLVVTVLHHRLGWQIFFADATGIAVYVGLSSALLLVMPVPFGPALVGVVALWAVVMLLLRHRAAAGSPATVPATGPPAEPGVPGGEPTTAARRDGLPVLAKLLVIFVGAVLTVLFGQLLQGMVVTFPYSGVLVAVETRRTLPEFSRHFARNSIALVAFMAGYYWLRASPEPVALAGAWTAFAATALILQLPRLRAARRRAWSAARWPRPGSSPSDAPSGPAAAGRSRRDRVRRERGPTRSSRSPLDRLVPRRAPGGR
jgi:hypothetical protein